MRNVTPLESTYPLIIAGVFGIFGQLSATFALKQWSVRKLQLIVCSVWLTECVGVFDPQPPICAGGSWLRMGC